ncbi:MAG: ribulose phosphate epimerase [Nannocystaceae bacterium]
MRNTFIITGMLAGALSIVGCGDKENDTADSATTTAGPDTTDGTDTDPTTTTGMDTTTTTGGSDTDGPTDPTTTTTTDDPTTTTDTTSDTDPFLVVPDTAVAEECSTYEEDCPDGQKCMPFANDGGNAWNALKCVDVVGEGGHGDPCTVEGNGVSGVDDCELHAMCWDVDPETNEGICTAFCDGTPESNSCQPDMTNCVIINEGVLNLCLLRCNPLIQDCTDGQACYPIGDAYTCIPVAVPPEEGLEGNPCEFLNACQAGLMCLNSGLYPGGCDGAGGCCSGFCDLSAPDCTVPMTECIAINENPTPGQEDYGVCALPE